MTTLAVAVLAVLLPLVVFDLVATPTIRRLGLRNVVRRPGEAALMVGGALLATALITASFIIGDSFGSSIRNLALDRWGPVDELVVVSEPDAIGPALAAIEEAPTDLVDGALGAVFLDVTVASVEAGDSGPARTVEPDARVLELQPEAAVMFSGDSMLFGPGPQLMSSADVVLNERLAAELGVAAGDPVDVYLDGEPLRFAVAAVRPATGLNGFGPLLMIEGAISDRLEDPATASTSAVLVSNLGDVFSGADLTTPVIQDLQARLGPGVEIEDVKRELLLEAEQEAAGMTELFGTIGGFSVAAGILLVINLFVMLASERKSEMGTLRATGLRRGHLVRAYSLEGAAYGVAAAVLGTVMGIGVAAVVMTMAQDVLGTNLTIGLAVLPSSLLSGAVIGLAVSQLTVLLTSWRVTRLNIVRALRDLPEPPSPQRSRRALALGVLGTVGGAVAYALAGTDPIVAMLGPAVAFVSAVPILSRFLARRVATAIGASAALAWTAGVFGLLPEVMDDPDVFLFLLQGVLLVGLATVIVAVGDRIWLAVARRVTGGGIGTRLGLAEPLARPVRTALLVAMYALVIFTVTFMAVMNSVFQAQVPEFAGQAGGEFDLVVDANPSSGLTTTEVASNPGVSNVAPIVRGRVSSGREAQPEVWFDERISGIDASFDDVAPPPLASRSEGFASDADAWAAIAAGEPYVMADLNLDLEPGERLRLYRRDESFVTLTVAGTTEQGWLVGAGLIASASAALDAIGENRPPTRFYAAVSDGFDSEAVAAGLRSDLVDRGADAETFVAAAKSEVDEQQGFINLLQGYLGLGLLIGIAGLGVVLVRAVRERRRQFGVMRALGIAAPVIRRAFIVEAAFVALQGVVLGIGLGLLSSWRVLTKSSAFESGLSFAAPVGALVVLAIGCLAASLVMAALPAIRAGRTSPAVALRMTT